jgi:hypothetical protein
MLLDGERRLEAETYLSTGFGIRVGIEKQSGWCRLGDIAKVWMPGRLKGIQVSQEFGVPYLAATQVYDIQPIPRKWLALEKTNDLKTRLATQGTILVTRSGAVGRATVSYKAHEGLLISDDLLRIEANNDLDIGWIYGFLHSAQLRAMAVGAHYGHIIKHLEPEHLQEIPIPLVSGLTAERFSKQFDEIIRLRNKSHHLTLEAEDRFSSALGAFTPDNWGEQGFSIKTTKAFRSGRRRFDAASHNPGATAIRQHLAKNGRGFIAIGDAGYDLWLPKRFRRIPAEDGVWMLDSADLTETNPVLTKRIADGDFGDEYGGRVKAGWVLMARSGQTYGIIGTPVLATPDLERMIISDHVMRIKPSNKPAIAPGYLATAIGHPTLGRPLVKSLAYGSSIPEIDVLDMAAHEIVRLTPDDEDSIAALATEAADAKSEADMLERKMSAEASDIIEAFIAGKRLKTRTLDPQQPAQHILDVFAHDG